MIMLDSFLIKAEMEAAAAAAAHSDIGRLDRQSPAAAAAEEAAAATRGTAAPGATILMVEVEVEPVAAVVPRDPGGAGGPEAEMVADTAEALAPEVLAPALEVPGQLFTAHLISVAVLQ